MSVWRNNFPAIIASQDSYLDNAATTQLVEDAIESITICHQSLYAPIHRGLYPRAEYMTEMYEQVRLQIAQIMGVYPDEIIFTSGTTAAINMVAFGWACHMLQRGDAILIPVWEHHANLLPWIEVARTYGFEIRIIPVCDNTLRLDKTYIDKFLDHRVKLIAFAPHSNLIGPIHPHDRELLQDGAQAVGAKMLLDCAQMVSHQPLSEIIAMRPDFALFSGHKMFGPSGIGVLYCSRARHEEMRPIFFGGGMVEQTNIDIKKNITEYQSIWKALPHRLEAGTPPIMQVVGFGAAVAYLARQNFLDIRTYEAALITRLLRGLMHMPHIDILGDISLLQTEGHMVTCAIQGVHAHDLGAALGDVGICVRAGQHCCEPLHISRGLSNTLRISCALYTTEDDIDRALYEIDRIVYLLRK